MSNRIVMIVCLNECYCNEWINKNVFFRLTIKDNVEMIKLQKLLAEKGNTLTVLEGRFLQQQEVQETAAIRTREHLYSKGAMYKKSANVIFYDFAPSAGRLCTCSVFLCVV